MKTKLILFTVWTMGCILTFWKVGYDEGYRHGVLSEIRHCGV